MHQEEDKFSFFYHGLSDRKKRNSDYRVKTKNYLILIIVALLGGCDYFTSSTAEFYQKLSVTVEVDGQLVTGESVTKVTRTIYKDKLLPHARSGRVGVRGEATVVDLGKGYYLFALLSAPLDDTLDAKRIARLTFEDLLPKWQDYRRVDGDGKQKGWMLTKDTNKTLESLRVSRAPIHMPFLVTFEDISRPKTFKVVDAGYMLEAFPEDIFSSLELVDISLELVDRQPVTEKIEGLLPWIPDYKEQGFRMSGMQCGACPLHSDNLADLISAWHFKKGD